MLGLGGLHSDRSDSQDCFNFINEQIIACSDTHENCEPLSKGPLPARVVDIGLCGSDNIVLFESHYNSEHYATLSHCWGDTHPPKTTRSNIGEMIKNISWRDLPKVFQDGIRVCRRLGLRYIWIDSLCILQDSKEDWEIESAKMSDYYENAYITISAESSANGSIPFLAARNLNLRAQKFDFNCRDGSQVLIWARHPSGSPWSYPNDLHDRDPLLSRAWAWQENALSRRILRYFKSEVIWECRSTVCAEDGVSYAEEVPPVQSQLLRGCKTEAEVYERWQRIVGAYARRRLAYDTDRLPAVSAAAAKFQSLTHSQYIAGLWAKNLPLDLCWVAVFHSDEAFDPGSSQYIAPSWAWPSVRGTINYHHSFTNNPIIPVAAVKDIHCAASRLNPFGQVNSGHIILTGPVVCITLSCSDPRNAFEYKIGKDPGHMEWLQPDAPLVEHDSSLKRAIEIDILRPFSVPVRVILLGHQEGIEGLMDNKFIVLALGQLRAKGYQRLGIAIPENADWFLGVSHETVRIV